MKSNKTVLFIIAGLMFLVQSYHATAQQNTTPTKNTGVDDKKLIQLSGVITAPDGKSAIPYATIHISHTYRGTIAGTDGFYSLVVAGSDTIEYQALGFKKLLYVMPASVADQKLNHSISLEADTLIEDPTQITLYLTKEEFRQAFLSLKLKDDLTERAKKNLDQETMRSLYENLARDGQENQLLTLQQIASSSYYAGGQKNYSLLGNGIAVPTSLLNPFAWAEFVKAVKEGKYKKNKEKEKRKEKQKDTQNKYDY